MTPAEEQEMHEWAKRLMALTTGTGWEAARYGAIARVMENLSTYCAVCDCQVKKGTPRPRHPSLSPYRR